MNKIYTEKEVVQLYKQHKSVSKISRILGRSNTYVTAILKRNKITILPSQPTKWTDDALKNEALKYKSRSEFSKKSGSAYVAAHNKGIINDICGHMEWLGHRYARHVYLCVFSNNTIYIGLSYDPDARFRQHINDTRSAIYRYSNETNEAPKLIYVTSQPINKEDAVALEIETINKYVSLGYNVLNDTTRKGGQLGVPDLFYTDDMLKEYALKFKTRNEMREDNLNLYNLINRRKLNHFFDHMDWEGNSTYDNEEVLKIAQKYKKRTELRKNEPKIWGYIMRNVLSDTMLAHMPTRKRIKRSFDEWLEITKKYDSLKDFMAERLNDFRAICKRDDYEQLVSHMKRAIRKKPTNIKRKLMIWDQKDIDYCADQYRLGKSIKEIATILTNKTERQIANKIHQLRYSGVVESNGTGHNVYNKDIVKEYIKNNNIKYKYGPDGLRAKNISMFWYLKRNDLFEEFLPEDDGIVRGSHNGKTYIMRDMNK